MLRDGGHIERAERPEKPALALRRFDGEQLIEKRCDPGGCRPGDDGLGNHLESFQLVRVEELGRVRRDRGFLLRVLDARRAGQMLVDRVLRFDDRRQRESCADTAE